MKNDIRGEVTYLFFVVFSACQKNDSEEGDFPENLHHVYVIINKCSFESSYVFGSYSRTLAVIRDSDFFIKTKPNVLFTL